MPEKQDAQEFIYRAKTTEGEFIEGILIEGKIFNGCLEKTQKGYLIPEENLHSIDTSTLCIHIPEVLDSIGCKLFAGMDNDAGDLLTDPRYPYTLNGKRNYDARLLFLDGCLCTQLILFDQTRSGISDGIIETVEEPQDLKTFTKISQDTL